MESRPRKLLDQVRDAIRVKHYSYRTEQTYVGWIRSDRAHFTPIVPMPVARGKFMTVLER